MDAPRLLRTATVEEQWRLVAEPWLREWAREALEHPRPTVILTPSRAEGFYLRGRLLEEGVSFLGLRFWTPSDARKFLLAESEACPVSATQAELRLLARSCAERLLEKQKADAATLTSVIREPAAFLRAHELLSGAGWDPATQGAAYGRDLAREFQREMEKLGIATQAGIHRALREKAEAKKQPLLAGLLVAGFNGVHWPLWDLLQAVMWAAETATVGLISPGEFGKDADMLWQDSWEQVFRGGIVDAPASGEVIEAPLTDLADSYRDGVARRLEGAPVDFVVTPDLASQTQAVVLQALDYLGREDCTRLGIVFAEANALALGVAEELRGLKIPLDDATGAIQPGLFERRCWTTWLALQEEPGVRTLIAWLRACEGDGVSFGPPGKGDASEMASVVGKALNDVLTDDLDFILEHLEAHEMRRSATVTAEFLRRRVALPSEATFAAYLRRTREAVGELDWSDYLTEVEVEPPMWLRGRKGMISRRTFLEWLREATDSRMRVRGAEGNHFYGRVHLLVYGQAAGQTWSHLILTGQNEGVWPRLFEPGAFLSRYELTQLNTQARQLNKRASVEGVHGAGHEAVTEGKGYCLLPLDRQALAVRDLCLALKGTRGAACFAAMTSEAGRSFLPSDFLNHAWQSKAGQVMDESVFRALATQTAAWGAAHAELIDDEEPVSEGEVGATLTAYQARRDATQPFGPYEFSYARPPALPVQLYCKQWSDAWNHPSSVWLEQIVGAGAWASGEMSWQVAIGTWAHNWLRDGLRRANELGTAAAFSMHVRAAADRARQETQAHANRIGVSLYPWWDQVWAEAFNVAQSLALAITPALMNRKFVPEFPLPGGLAVALPGMSEADFELKGRVDLVMAMPGSIQCDPAAGIFTGAECWVVDYKTGSAKKLTEKKVATGDGLQPVLYALAVRELGAAEVDVSIQTRDAELKPQVSIEGIVKAEALFRSLDLMHRRGIFGMRPDAENPYGYSPNYPMATRFVPAEILEKKWALVHGGEVVAEIGEDE